MENKMEKIISLCKRRGFVFQGSEIYGGLAGTWDYGPLGVALKNNIQNLWWKRFVLDREDMYGMDAAILMNQNVWKSSGHVAGFSDPLVEDLKTKKRYRADHLLEDAGVDPKGMKFPDMDKVIKEKGLKSPEGNPLGEVRQFNMMLQTSIGAIQDDSSVSYLRPETAGGMFVNFKNVLDSLHPKLPFGMAQIGKAFRNEIAPRDFIFRVRELEQMEIEYFIKADSWKENFEAFRKEVWEYTKDVGLSQDKVHELEVADEDRAHYSKRTIDFEFDFPFGKKELYGLAYRTDFDLKAHTVGSTVDLSYFDEETKERYVPHVIEPSFGVGRTLLAVLSDAYTEDNLGGEVRTFLKLSPKVAPFLVAVSPLLKNKPELMTKAREVYNAMRKVFPGRVIFDDNGNIGKRYRRQDEIGTPYCVVIDFDTIEKNTGVTIRHRDTGEQERKSVEEVIEYIKNNI
ncbi:MAG: glycyl tRNA synthetase [Candidatus Taylorbacteria bacterium]|nr:glycyl tRNA synthetase [Candidatus Taylorbacteria bacterium]